MAHCIRPGARYMAKLCNTYNYSTFLCLFSPLSTLKSTLACPTHLLNVLFKQTNLDEPSIHVRYMKFRERYPTGYIGPNVFRDLCSEILGPHESQKFCDLVFDIYGRRRNGNGTKNRTFRSNLMSYIEIDARSQLPQPLYF